MGLLRLIMLLSFLSLFTRGASQYDPIGLYNAVNEETLKVNKSYQNIDIGDIGGVNWTLYKDEMYTLLDSNQISNQLVLTGFNFHLKPIKKIRSFRLLIKNKSSDTINIRNVRIELFDSLSVFAITNRKVYNNDINRIVLNISKENYTKLNNSGFGIKVTFTNGKKKSIISISEISLALDYEPVFQTCSDEILTFYVNQLPSNYKYSWRVPQDAIITSSADKNIVNIIFKGDNFGAKLISVLCTSENDTLQGNYSMVYSDCRLSEITGRLVIDSNCNNNIDSAELGIRSKQIRLFEGLIFRKSVTTDITGKFQFNQIPKGYYNIVLDNQEDVFLNEVNNSNAQIHFSKKNNTILSDEFYLEPNFEIDSIDLLFDKGIDYGFTLWEDNNLNGIFDSVEVVDSSKVGSILRSVNYGVSKTSLITKGKYEFENLRNGIYQFCLEADSDLFLNEGSDENCVDVDINCIDSLKEINIEVFRKGSISGKIWIDENEDGERNEENSGLSDIEITILDTFGIIQSVVYSDSIGEYVFYNLELKTYYLQIKSLDSLDLTSVNIGSPEVNSDFKLLNNRSITDFIKVESGESVANIDCGFVLKKCKVGDFVWFDTNEDGIQDIDEKGMNGIEVRLFSDSNLVQTTYSKKYNGEDGYYIFEGVKLGNYYIEIILPDGYKLTSNNSSIDSLNSDIDFNSFRSIFFKLKPGDIRMDIDIGLVYNYASIKLNTWFDEIGNGLFDNMEKGVDSIIFELVDINGENVDKSISIAQNQNLSVCYFDSILSRNYYILVKDLKGRYRPVELQLGSNRNKDSDFYIQNGIIRTNEFFIRGGQTIDSLDLGLITNYSSIAGFVWEDTNENGIIDNVERGIGGIEIELYDEFDNIVNTIKSSETGDIGKYSFDKLHKGNYYIRFVKTDDLEYSEGVGVNMDISGDNGVGTTSLINLNWGESKIGIDGALVNNKSNIGDYVWLDSNNDGIQDSNEYGVEGVKIFLLAIDESVIDSTISKNDGSYSFIKIEEGEYRLRFEIDDKYNFTLFNKSDQFGSKAVGNTNIGLIEIFEVKQGIDILDLDAGLVYDYSTIGDEVWLDLNSNGLHEDDEFGLEDVDIYLFDKTNNLIDSTTTDSLGKYSFSSVISGEYYLKLSIADSLEVIPNSSIYSITHNNGINSTSVFYIEAGVEDNNIDFGLGLKKGHIGDYIWLDTNKNGIQDIEERGINEVVVLLFNEFGELVDQTISKIADNHDGYYGFDVDKGNYFLQFIVGDSLEIARSIDEDANLNSDITGAFGFNSTDLIQVKPGVVIKNIDAGFIYKDIVIGGRFWFDSNGDGKMESEEEGFNSREVTLYNLDGIVAETTTYTSNIGSGFYIFKGLEKGKYYLKFESLDDYSNTLPLVSTSKRKKSFISNANGEGTTDIFDLTPGTKNLFVNGGLVFKTENFIGDFVWEDTNENGIQDFEEKGINGVKISLYNQNDSLVEITYSKNFPSSDKAGYYSFNNVQIGDYYVKFKTTIGQAYSKPNNGDGKNDSDVISALGETKIFHMDKLTRLTDIDAGIIFLDHGSIGDFVWEDMNGNKIQDEGEPGINGVKIKLYRRNADGKDIFVKTEISHYNEELNQDGYYLFNNLANRNYWIKLQKPDSLILIGRDYNADPSKNSDIERVTLSSDLIELGFEEKRTDIDIGFKRHAKVGDFIWLDENENGLQDQGEIGIANIFISLIGKNNPNKYDTYSDVSGKYQFSKVHPGEYYLKVGDLNGFKFTKNGVGDEAIDSDIINGDGTSSVFSILSGSSTDNKDIGLVKLNNYYLNTYPNPVVDKMNLSFNIEDKIDAVKIIVSTIKGNVVRTIEYNPIQGTNKLEIDLQGLKSGYYTVTILENNEIKYSRYFMKSE